MMVREVNKWSNSWFLSLDISSMPRTGQVQAMESQVFFCYKIESHMEKWRCSLRASIQTESLQLLFASLIHVCLPFSYSGWGNVCSLLCFNLRLLSLLCFFWDISSSILTITSMFLALTSYLQNTARHYLDLAAIDIICSPFLVPTLQGFQNAVTELLFSFFKDAAK